MNNIKTKFILGLCFFMFFGLVKADITTNAVMQQQRSKVAPKASLVEMNKIVAIVNSDVVTQVDLDKKIAEIQRHFRNTRAPELSWSKLRKKSLDELIDISLQLQLAKRNGLKVEDAHLNQVIANIAKGNKLTIPQLKKVLPEREGMSFEEFRKKLRQQALISKLQQQFLSKGIVVSKKDVDAVLRNPPKVGEVPAGYHVYDILLKFPEDASKKQKNALKLEAKNISSELRKLRQKKDIDALVEKIEEANKSVDIDGIDLGWRKISDFPDIFIKYVPKMKAGQVSSVIEAANGLHLLKMLDVKKAEIMRAKITKDQAKEIVYRRKLEKKLKPWLKELRKKAYIKYY